MLQSHVKLVVVHLRVMLFYATIICHVLFM